MLGDVIALSRYQQQRHVTVTFEGIRGRVCYQQGYRYRVISAGLLGFYHTF